MMMNCVDDENVRMKKIEVVVKEMIQNRNAVALYNVKMSNHIDPIVSTIQRRLVPNCSQILEKSISVKTVYIFEWHLVEHKNMFCSGLELFRFQKPGNITNN